MNAETKCRFEDLSPAERRKKLSEPQGVTHVTECLPCSTFLALDMQLRALARLVPPPPARARWAHARARWIARNESSEQATFYGDLVARLLGVLGALGAVGLFARALRAGAEIGSGGGAEIGPLLAVVGGAAISFVLLTAVYRVWSEP